MFPTETFASARCHLAPLLGRIIFFRDPHFSVRRNGPRMSL